MHVDGKTRAAESSRANTTNGRRLAFTAVATLAASFALHRTGLLGPMAEKALRANENARQEIAGRFVDAARAPS